MPQPVSLQVSSEACIGKHDDYGKKTSSGMIPSTRAFTNLLAFASHSHYFNFLFQLMNAPTPGSLTIVIRERRARTLSDHFCAHVTRDFLEMELIAKIVSEYYLPNFNFD